jgi:RNA polymerase-interacting CarD/CdnL/TRCF family regulator
MSFNVGDHVVHVNHGSGQIVAIKERQFTGSEVRLFYEVATNNKSTVWVPVESAAPSSLRLLISKDDLARCREVLKSEPGRLDPNRRQRYLDVSSRLKLGSFKGMCEVLRDLAAFGWAKPLSDADSLLFRKTLEDICWEWAQVNSEPLAKVRDEITGLLQECRAAFAAH